MNRRFVAKSNDPQCPAVKQDRLRPKSITVIILSLDFQWLINNFNAQFFGNIRAFFQHFIFKILCKTVPPHCSTHAHRLQIFVHRRFLEAFDLDLERKFALLNGNGA